MARNKREVRQPPRWVTVMMEDLNRYVRWQVLRIVWAQSYNDAQDNPDRDLRAVLVYHFNRMDVYSELLMPIGEVRSIIYSSAQFRAQCFSERRLELAALKPESDACRELDTMLTEREAVLRYQEATLTKVDLERILRCPGCNNLYWVTRRDARGCSKCCGRLRGRAAWKKREIAAEAAELYAKLKAQGKSEQAIADEVLRRTEAKLH